MLCRRMQRRKGRGRRMRRCDDGRKGLGLPGVQTKEG